MSAGDGERGRAAREVMHLLETGRRADARVRVAELRSGEIVGESRAETDLLERLALALGPSPSAHPAAPPSGGSRDEAPPASGEASSCPGDLRGVARGGYQPRELEDAVAALDHAREASVALRTGDTPRLVAEAVDALARTPRSMPWLLFHVGSLLQAAYRFSGSGGLRARALAVLGPVGDRVDLPHLAIQARALAGNVHMLHGGFHRTLVLCDAALELAEVSGLANAPATAMAWQFRGYVLFEWNRLAEAERSLERAWELGGNAVGVGSGTARMMARLRSVAGDPDGAGRWLARLDGLVHEPMSIRNREWMEAVRSGQALGAGELRAVEAWVATWGYHAGEIGSWSDAEVHARLSELESLLTLLEATSQWGSVLQVAPRVAAATGDDRRWFAVRARTAEAVALEAEGRSAEAGERFWEALDLGREGSLVRAYLEGSPLRVRLLERAREGSAAEAARRVLSAAPELASPVECALSPTQARVLHRIAAGASNKSIARDLGVSVSTVKTHVRAIFARLHVSSRTQAAARARERGLLP